MKNLNLTELEEKTVNELVNNSDFQVYDEDYTDYSYWSNSDIETLSKLSNIATKQLRGVISSLIKKDVVYLEDTDCDGTEFIYINEKYLKLFFKNESK